jgi:aquaglyceroporin related protein, other eukaryote
MVGYGPEVWRAGDYYFWVCFMFLLCCFPFLRHSTDPRFPQVPMICPFIGCTLGGFLYDALIFTGDSPINTPWMGVKRVVRPSRKGIKQAWSGKPEPEKQV